MSFPGHSHLCPQATTDLISVAVYDVAFSTVYINEIISYILSLHLASFTQNPCSEIHLGCRMQKFLSQLEITFRGETNNYRPRMNKRSSIKDAEQKQSGNDIFLDDQTESENIGKPFIKRNIYWDLCYISFNQVLCPSSTNRVYSNLLLSSSLQHGYFASCLNIPVDGCLGYFQFGAITNEAAMDMHTEAFVWACALISFE